MAEPGLFLPFPVLADPNNLVHRQDGAVDRAGAPALRVFVVDQAGSLLFRALGGPGEALPSAAETLHLLDADDLTPELASRIA